MQATTRWLCTAALAGLTSVNTLSQAQAAPVVLKFWDNQQTESGLSDHQKAAVQRFEAENPGIMTLARRYHLQGTLAALVVLALLFLWKNMVSLVPPSPAGNTACAITAAISATAPGWKTKSSRPYYLNPWLRGAGPAMLARSYQWRT